MNFKIFGFDGIDGETIKSTLETLIEVVDAHVKKAKTAEREDMAISDAGAMRALRDIRSWVDAAQSNGVGWLLNNTEFLTRLAVVSSIIRQSVGRNVDLRARIARLAVDQVHADITDVQNAAVAAKAVLGTTEIVEESEKRISTIKGEVETSLGAVSKVLEEAQDVAIEVGQKKDEISKIAEEVLSAKQAVDAAKKEAESESSALKGSLEELNDSIANSIKKSDGAIKELDIALRDARRQGLAKAFSDRHKAAQKEYFSWAFVFLVAIASLVFLGVLQFKAFQIESQFAVSGQTVDKIAAIGADKKDNVQGNAMINASVKSDAAGLYQVLKRILAELPLAIPLVWLGWYCAKRIGSLSRLMQDYEYKAAAALAFESYKNEVELFGDSALSEQLLATAIKNFGENPVRLFEVSDKNHAHPLESLIETLKDEKAYDRLMNLLTKLKGGS